MPEVEVEVVIAVEGGFIQGSRGLRWSREAVVGLAGQLAGRVSLRSRGDGKLEAVFRGPASVLQQPAIGFSCKGAECAEEG